MSKNSSLLAISDEELLVLYKKSAKVLYIKELFIRYLPLIYGTCLKYLKNSDMVKEAVMQIFNELCNEISDYEIDTFRPWIYSVVKNHCLQTNQEKEHSIVVDFCYDEDSESKNLLHILEEEINKKEKSLFLTNFLNNLPERQQLSFTYFFIKKLTYVEIVDRTGYTLSDVKDYIQNAKENLKIYISQQ